MAAKVSLKYYLLSTRTTKGELPIYLRITLDRKKAELHTGYVSTVKDWNKEEQLTKANNTIHQELANKKGRVYELILELERKNKPVSAAILKDIGLLVQKKSISGSYTIFRSILTRSRLEMRSRRCPLINTVSH